MTSYIVITDPETDPDAPLTSELAKKWRDNPIAAFEGDPTAVAAKVTLRGEAVATVATGLPVLNVSPADTYTLIEDPRAGLTAVAGVTGTSSTTDVVARTYTFTGFLGTVRFKASHDSNEGATSALTLFKVGFGVLQTWSTTSSSPVSRVHDGFVAPGDVYEWRHRKSSGGAGSSQVSDFSVTANRRFVDTPVYRVEG